MKAPAIIDTNVIASLRNFVSNAFYNIDSICNIFFFLLQLELELYAFFKIIPDSYIE